MKVAIINTPAKGTEVHAHNCADVKKSESRNGDAAWIIDAESRVGVSMEYWADIIGDQVEPDSVEGWKLAEDYIVEFNFLPCASALPADHRDEAPATEEAPATAVTTWVGKAIAARILSGSFNSSLTTKFNEAKPTKAGDRTVKLTAEEATELRAFCTELETVGGSIAYSARTLRARIS